jgi:hypothetical protein
MSVCVETDPPCPNGETLLALAGFLRTRAELYPELASPS